MANDTDIFLKFKVNAKELESELVKFQKGFKKSVDGKGIDIEVPKEFKNASKGFLSASKGLLKAFGIGSPIAMLALAGKMGFSHMSSVSGIARVWGRSPQEVSQFQGMYASFGGSAEEAEQLFTTIGKGLSDMRLFAEGSVMDMNRMFNLGLRRDATQEQVIGAMRTRAGSLNHEQIRQMLSMIGMDTPAGMRLVTSSNTEHRKAMEEAKRLSRIDESYMESIEEFQKSWRELLYSLKELAIEIKPALDGLTSVFKTIRAFTGGDEEKTNLAKEVWGTAVDVVSSPQKLFNRIYDRAVDGGMRMLGFSSSDTSDKSITQNVDVTVNVGQKMSHQEAKSMGEGMAEGINRQLIYGATSNPSAVR